MDKPMTLNVRVSGRLSDFIAANVGDEGLYDNVSEYIRDLVRKDRERCEQARFEQLRAELAIAFAAPDDSYEALTVRDVIARNPVAA